MRTATITNQSVTSNLKFNDTLMLEITIEDFNVTLKSPTAQRQINNAIKTQSSAFLTYALHNLYPMAVKDYLNSQQQDFPFNNYQALLIYTLTYNENCTLSYYADNYQFTGGAHGSTLRTSNTFSLKTGKPILLNAFFAGNYRQTVLTEMLRQAEQNLSEQPGIYFEDYKKLIVQHFNPNSFYLTNAGVVIYYQQYQIAPYSSGIIEFTIPYQRPPQC